MTPVINVVVVSNDSCGRVGPSERAGVVVVGCEKLYSIINTS